MSVDTEYVELSSEEVERLRDVMIGMSIVENAQSDGAGDRTFAAALEVSRMLGADVTDAEMAEAVDSIAAHACALLEAMEDRSKLKVEYLSPVGGGLTRH